MSGVDLEKPEQLVTHQVIVYHFLNQTFIIKTLQINFYFFITIYVLWLKWFFPMLPLFKVKYCIFLLNRPNNLHRSTSLIWKTPHTYKSKKNKLKLRLTLQDWLLKTGKVWLRILSMNIGICWLRLSLIANQKTNSKRKKKKLWSGCCMLCTFTAKTKYRTSNSSIKLCRR